MNLLITGAAGNLGSHLARHLIESNRAVQESMNDQSDAQPASIDQPSRASQNLHHLKLLIHRHELPAGIARAPNVTIPRADLANPAPLAKLCQNTDCIIHFAGVLFAPRPNKFLPTTNTLYVQNLVNAALAAGVGKFILVSFPLSRASPLPSTRPKALSPATPPQPTPKPAWPRRSFSWEPAKARR